MEDWVGGTQSSEEYSRLHTLAKFTSIVEILYVVIYCRD